MMIVLFNRKLLRTWDKKNNTRYQFFKIPLK
jgi:hypothetical protein